MHITTSELYLRRADKFENDEKEGLPPEGYFPKPGMHSLDVRDAVEMNNHTGFLAQIRQGFYVRCWCLIGEDNSAAMWKKFAREGLAVASSYSFLKGVVGTFEDDVQIGQIRYGATHMTGWNVHRFITTKRTEFEHERKFVLRFGSETKCYRW